MVDVFKLSSTDLVQRTTQRFEQMMGGMRLASLVPWQELGVEQAPSVVDGRFLRTLDHDTRRAVLDKIHDISLLHTYEGNTPHEREARHQSVATEARQAKWQCLLALVNDAYDIGLDYVDLEILSPLYAQLGEIERGATNPHMPTTHKLRHNPSIHSLHVAGLIYDIMGETEASLDHAPEDAREELQQMRCSLMEAALVHDMGELEGELSVAHDRKHMTAAELAAFEAHRGFSETEIFHVAIEDMVGNLAERQWPRDMLESKQAKFQAAYAVAEESNVFIGRAHKIMERIQTQQDYLRFAERDFTPPLRTIPYQHTDHRPFFMTYVPDTLFGVSKGESVSDSLRLLAEREQGSSRIVADALLNALELRVDNLQQAIGHSLGLAGKTESFEQRIQRGREVAKPPQR